jgi:hypothetical protein
MSRTNLPSNDELKKGYRWTDIKPKFEKSDLQPLCKDKDCKCPAHPEYCCTQRRKK